MMGRQKADESQLFYLFNLEARIPAHHLLRRINPTVTWIPTADFSGRDSGQAPNAQYRFTGLRAHRPP
jgi:hypothetical protein